MPERRIAALLDLHGWETISRFFPTAATHKKETNMQRWILPVAATAFCAAALFSVPAANAQEQSPSPAQPGVAQSIPDQKLDATAAAIERVASLKEDYQQKIAAAQPSERQRVADEAQDALVKAVTDQGLSVEEYTAILTVAQADAQVRDKIMERLKPSSEK